MTPEETRLYNAIRARFERPDVDIFASDSWRVICWNVRAHKDCCCGQLSGCGSTLLEAMTRILDAADTAECITINGTCKKCLDNYDGY